MSSSSDLKVGIVDDSPLIREILRKVIDSTAGMSVVGLAEDPYEAREMIKATTPDVITLDIEMPKMNGLEFLNKIMKLRPMPVIMVSTLTQKGASATLQALETGAVDYVAKPDIHTDADDILSYLTRALVPKLNAVRGASFTHFSRFNQAPQTLIGEHSAIRNKGESYDLIGIASSTGGVERLRYIAKHLTANIPPVLIVQHINQAYVHNLCQRLQSYINPKYTVKPAEHQEILKANHIYFADNVHHLEIVEGAHGFKAKLSDHAPLNGFKASADYLFASMSKCTNKKMLGICLSGMGTDGAQGLKELSDAQGNTLGESEESCLIYGMSRAAKQIGAINQELSLEQILAYLNGIIVR